MKIVAVVHPNANKPKIEKDLTETLHIYISAPPLDGKANLAAIEALSDYYDIPKSKIKIIRGEKSKHKVFEIKD